MSWEPNGEELDDYPEPAFEPLVIIACALSAGALLQVLADIGERFRYPGGELFDLRKGKFKRRPLPRQEKGALVFLTDKGVVKFPPEKRTDGLAYLTKALSRR
jgi:hypothetical protein